MTRERERERERERAQLSRLLYILNLRLLNNDWCSDLKDLFPPWIYDPFMNVMISTCKLPGFTQGR